jgi:hypothetical protein
LVENQFARTVGKSAQLQASGVTRKKRVVLEDLGRALIGQGGGRSDQITDPRNPCFYFYIPGHGVTVAT